jgi:hypothetical protein
LDEVNREFGDLIGRKGQGGGRHIAKLLVEGGQLLPQIYVREIHKPASGGAAVLFGGDDQASPDSGALTLRIDCQQSEVTALAAQFNVNATRQHSVLDVQEEFAFLKKGANFLGICTVGVYIETLRAKGGVHQACDCGRVGGFSGTHLRRIRQRLDFTSGPGMMVTGGKSKNKNKSKSKNKIKINGRGRGRPRHAGCAGS